MKRANLILISLAAISITLGSARGAEWYAYNNTYLYDSANSALPTATYLVQLVVDVSGNTDFAAMMSGSYMGVGAAETKAWTVHASASDDVVVSSDGLWEDAGGGQFWADSVITPLQASYPLKRYYFRWVNAADYVSATEAGIIYNTAVTYAWTAGQVDPPLSDADTGYSYGDPDAGGTVYTAGDYDGWKTIAPVPEPGTMGLMAVGLAAVALRRKFRKA